MWYPWAMLGRSGQIGLPTCQNSTESRTILLQMPHLPTLAQEQSNKAEASLWEFLHLSPSVLVIVCFIPGDPMESPTMPSKSYAPLWPRHNCWYHSKSTCQMTLNNPKPIRTWWLSQKTAPRIVCYSKLQNLRKSNIKVPAGMFGGSCFMHDFIPSIDYQRAEFVSQMLRIIS